MQYTLLPIFQVGKEGINKEHLAKALKDHNMIKVKFLKKELMSNDLPGIIVKKIGRTIILKENKKIK
jgi:RNA-binding protein YhbY